MINKIKGFIFAFMLFSTSFFGYLFIASPILPLAVFAPRVYRKLMDNMIGYWEYLCVALLEVFLGLKIVLSGDKIINNERNLIIMNHRTRLDWMFFWCVLFRDSNVPTEKIILKEPLKHVPGAGWAMQAASYIFLKRKWEDDKSYITDILNYLSKINHKSQILIFPEGTDFCPNSTKRSDAFAAKNNLKPYKYVLHPRTTGFVYILQTMKNNKHLDAVYDITVGYPDTLCTNEISFAFGKRPKTVHFHIDRHPIENLPQNDEDLATWCKDIWHKKEETLSAFYNETKKFDDAREDTGNRNQLFIALIYWFFVLFFIFFLLYQTNIARFFLLFNLVVSYLISSKGGIELYSARSFYTYTGFFKN